MKRPEQALQTTVCGYFRWALPPEVAWNHVPNGGYRREIEAKILKSIGVRAGWPDLQLVYQGRLYAIELKAGKGKLTENQKACHDWLLRAGASVGVANHLEAVKDLLGLWKIPTRERKPTAVALERSFRMVFGPPDIPA